jgi:hypothetical protein
MEVLNMTEINIGKDTFRLRLNTRSSIQLEKALGYNPLNMLIDAADNKMPKKMDVITMLHAMLQAYHHGYTLDKTMDLFDLYIDDGHNMFEIIPTFVEVLTDAGYIPKDAEGKNEGTNAKN